MGIELFQYQAYSAPVLLENDPVPPVADTSTEWIPCVPMRRSRPPRRRHPDNANPDLLKLGEAPTQFPEWLSIAPHRAHLRPRLRHQHIAFVDHVAGESLIKTEFTSVTTFVGIEIGGYRGYGRWRE